MIQKAVESDRIEEAVGFLRTAIPSCPSVAMVLGSGMAGLCEEIADPLTIPYADVPHWPVPEVGGHRAELVIGALGGVAVACLTGRAHLYEGWEPADVVRSSRSLCQLGVKSFLLTNAAGGIAEELRVGDLMVVRDHLNLTGCSPLTGRAEVMLGPRFSDQGKVYGGRLRRILAVADAELTEGVYAGMLGPAYETPAEVQMIRTLGASAVGMSTVHEAMALHSMGAEVAAVSSITNLAAGLGGGPLSHDEVLDATRRISERLARLITEFCSQI